MIGRIVDGTVDLERVKVRADGRIVADRAESERPGRLLLTRHTWRPPWLLKQFQQLGPTAVGDDLAEYDRAFGLVANHANEEGS